MEKICEACGKVYNASYKNQKYCSRQCWANVMDQKVTCICENCGKEYRVKKSEYEKAKHHYCCVECHNNAQKEIKICEYCGKEFVTTKGQNRRFCSHECAMKVIPFEQPTNKEKIICKQCGKEFMAHVSAHREFCSKECAYEWRRNGNFNAEYNEKRRIIGKENFYKKFNEVRDDIILLSEYVDAKTKIKCICKEHGNEFYMIPSHINECKTGCTQCQNRSKAERLINKLLREYNINFEQEKRFDECRDINTLPFDFYLPDFNKIIEYDGEQHFRPVNYGKISNEEAQINFIRTQKHDKIKNEYCQHNNIKLLRIPYTQFKNIKKLVIDFIYQ